MKSMGPAEFDRLVEQAFAAIPARFRRRMKNVVLVVEPEPPRPGLLGLYEGRPLTLRSTMDGIHMPDRITIFQGPHERSARGSRDLARLVEETVWHEVGHYFGMDEARIRRAERAWRARRDRASQAPPPPSRRRSSEPQP